MSVTDLDRFKAACVYPGLLDEQAVERELATFLRALGVSRRIVRLRAGSWLKEYPPLDAKWVLDELAQSNRLRRNPFRALRIFRDARRLRARLHAHDVYKVVDARAAQDAWIAAFPASFASVLISQCRFWGGVDAYISANQKIAKCMSVPLWRAKNSPRLLHFFWDLSYVVCSHFDRLRKPAVEAWLQPLFEAFVFDCWVLVWTDDTLYWVAKPTVRFARFAAGELPHHDTHAAFESDIVNDYYWRGVRVPSFVILKPDRITIARIDRETNAEVRRVLIERYRQGEEIHGAAAFIRDAGGVRLDHDERFGTLWFRNIPHDDVIIVLEVVNRTRESDGSFKRYWLRVPPGVRTAREAVAWTFNMPAEQYAPEIET
jgi:hypothetical protein